MKIAIISPWAVSANAVGGTERFIVDLAESLAVSGHELDVYMFDGNDHISNNVRYVSIKLLGEDTTVDEYTLQQHLGDFSLPDTYSLLADKIEQLIDLSAYDVIHINTQLLLRAWRSKRRVFTIHTNPFEYKQAWGDASYPTMIDAARIEAPSDNTVFTAPSDYYAAHFSQEIGTDVICIPHAIDPQRVTPIKDRGLLCEQYGLDSGKIHILLPSRLEPVQKQPGLLFGSLHNLPLGLLAKIEILSSGVDTQYEHYKHKYTKQAGDLGCSVFFGRFGYMSDAYTLADIVVLPSQSESFGYSALESLTLGIPTILNDIPTFREIADGNPAATFFCNDESELAIRIHGLIENGITRHLPSATWRKRYSISEWVKKYEKLL